MLLITGRTNCLCWSVYFSTVLGPNLERYLVASKLAFDGDTFISLLTLKAGGDNPVLSLVPLLLKLLFFSGVEFVGLVKFKFEVFEFYLLLLDVLLHCFCEFAQHRSVETPWHKRRWVCLR